MKVTIETPEGIVVRTVTNATLPAGEQTVIWDGRAGNRKPVAGGRYVVRVAATNELGSCRWRRRSPSAASPGNYHQNCASDPNDIASVADSRDGSQR